MNAASLSQKNRIAGGLIDRAKPLSFRFDGQHYTCLLYTSDAADE